MAITLTIESLGNGEISLPDKLELPFISVGRSKSSTKILLHQGISRHHFFIKYEQGNYYLVDENSLHGTHIDGVLLKKGEEFKLQSEHLIEIPGYRISLFNDYQKPTLEHTQTLARRFLDKSMSEAIDEIAPRLVTLDRKYSYILDTKKTTFSLGCSLSNDFVISSPSIHKNHITLTRDINGINIIPAEGKQVSVNGKLIESMTTLSHGDLIALNQLELVFQQFPDDAIISAQIGDFNRPIAGNSEPQLIESSSHEAKKIIPTAKRLGQNTDLQDKILCAAFFTAFFGALIIVWQLV